MPDKLDHLKDLISQAETFGLTREEFIAVFTSATLGLVEGTLNATGYNIKVKVTVLIAAAVLTAKLVHDKENSEGRSPFESMINSAKSVEILVDTIFGEMISDFRKEQGFS